MKTDTELYNEALSIIDDNLEVVEGVIGNRFATASLIVEFAKKQNQLPTNNSVSKSLYDFDRYVYKNHINDYYVVSTLLDFFGESDECQDQQTTSSNVTTFKEQLINEFIPRLEAMYEKEVTHLKHLIDIEAPMDYMKISQKTQFHLIDKIKEYKEYYDKL